MGYSTTIFYQSVFSFPFFLAFGRRIKLILGCLQEFLEFRHGMQVSQCGRCPQTGGLDIGGVVITGNHAAASILESATQYIVGCLTRSYFYQKQGHSPTYL